MSNSVPSCKVLKVSPSFASIEIPGSGLNAYYHSIYSNFQIDVLTECKGFTYQKVPSTVNIKCIKTFHSDLGKDLKDFKRHFLLILKFASTLVFCIKSIPHLQKIKPTLVHIYTPIHLLTAIYCKLFFKSKIILSLHGTDVLRLKQSKFLQRFINRIVDQTLAVSANTKSEVRWISNLRYLGNGFDSQKFYFSKSVKREKTFISVGNLRWQKNHEDLIRAFAEFHRYNSDYNLKIIGSGKLLKNLNNLISDLSLENKIELLGPKSQDEIAEILNSSECFVLSSISEGSPKAVYEAMACGLPIISTNVGNLSNVVNETNGILVDHGIANLVKGLNDYKLRASTFDRELISRLAFDHFTWNSIVAKLDEYYTLLIDGN